MAPPAFLRQMRRLASACVAAGTGTTSKRHSQVREISSSCRRLDWKICWRASRVRASMPYAQLEWVAWVTFHPGPIALFGLDQERKVHRVADTHTDTTLPDSTRRSPVVRTTVPPAKRDATRSS